MKKIKLFILFCFLSFLIISAFISCNAIEGDTRSASTLIIKLISDPDDTGKTVINSDVCVLDSETGQCTIYEDLASVEIQNMPLNPGTSGDDLSYYYDVTLKKYKVEFTRPDGKNTEGINVPHSFVGSINVTIPINSSVSFSFVIVPVRVKLEPPLTRLVGGEGEQVIETIANITFYGEDNAGNQMEVKGNIDVYFADWAD